MYKGKRHNGTRTGRKYIAILVSVVLLLTTVIGATLAWMMQKTDGITNIFTPSEVTTKVEETIDYDNNEKKEVMIANTGDTEAYIRAAVVVTWQDAEGNIHYQKPEAGTDYSIVYNTTDWDLAADGFWYHKAPVAAGANTKNLIARCSPNEEMAPAGYGLTVEILCSGIQSVPTKVVTEQWISGVSGVSGTTLTIKK